MESRQPTGNHQRVRNPRTEQQCSCGGSPYPRQTSSVCLTVNAPGMSASSQTVEHVGEWRVELRADTLTEIFEELARVIAGVAGTTSESRGPWEELDVEGRDREALLIDYANELVSRGEIDARAYDEVRDVVIRNDGRPRIQARVRGRTVTSWRSPLKAATYHGARLSRDAAGWRANVLFDV